MIACERVRLASSITSFTALRNGASRCADKNAGTPIARTNPMIATTIMISMSVKPDEFRVMNFE